MGPHCLERSSHPWRFCICCIAYGAACEPCPRGSLGGLLPFLGGAGSGRATTASVQPVDIPCFRPAANFMAVCFSCCAFSCVLQCFGRHSCRSLTSTCASCSWSYAILVKHCCGTTIAWPKLGHAHFRVGRPSHRQPFQTALHTISSSTSHTEQPNRSWAKRRVTGHTPSCPWVLTLPRLCP